MDSSVAPAGGAGTSTEHHRGERSGWLRAAVLGADDGIVSVASLAIGVAASGASHAAVVTAGFAALVAGAMSMAAGEYVSVSSQRDAEQGDLAQERRELARNATGEERELAAIYRSRGVSPELASRVATELMAHDALEAHARDELGMSSTTLARPLQAAGSSAVSFAIGAILPLLALMIAPSSLRVPALVVVSVGALVSLGVAGAKAGGAPIGRAALRVGMGGTAAIAVTAAVGHLLGSVGA